jgi:glycosyltransferase involved in cell wall biosynthesis
MTVLDVGAHRGLYTLLFSKTVGGKGRVIAFEPSPRECRRLEKHLSFNRCSNVHVERSAVGSEADEADLYLADGFQDWCNSLRPPALPDSTSIVRVRVRHGGQASAFNFGFEHARGEVVALLDADDIWLPGKLRRIHEAFERNPGAGMVYHRVKLWSGNGASSDDTYFVPVSGRVPERRRALLQYPMVGTSCLPFRRAVLKELVPVPEALRSQADAYLTALVIFIAPVVAVPEFLGKYRLHGANLFQTDHARPSPGQIERRIAMRAVLLSSIQGWLKSQGYDLDSADLRAYVKQWTQAQERDWFELSAPGRGRFFRHLLEFPLTYGEIMTARHRAYCYLRSFAALFLGYHHLHVLDDLRMKRKQWFTSSAKQGRTAEKENALAAKS